MNIICPKCPTDAHLLWTASDHEQHHKSFHPARPLTFPPLPPASEAAREVGPAVYTPRPYRSTSEDVLWYDASQITIKDEVTIGQFRELAQANGWSEDFLVEHCRGHMDNPREIVREILAGKGTTKPRFTGYDVPAKLTSLMDPVLVWAPLLKLYESRAQGCPCGCQARLTGKQRYATPGCRKRVQRLRDLDKTVREAA
jgi:hypothetical protein